MRADSIFALPDFSLRFVPVYLRNLLVWRKLALASVLGNIADPLITLVAFGYGLGRLLPQVDGVAYIVFLAAGSVCMSTAMAASFESLYSAFSRMQVQQTWQSILNAPVDLDDIVLAEWLWAASKSLFAGAAIVLVMLVLGISRSPTLIGLIPLVGMTGLVFAGLGLCFNALARGYDSFTYYFTLVISPMVFLSGVYYPVSALPDWLASFSYWLPLAAAVDLARPLVLGRWPFEEWPRLVLLVAYALGSFAFALVLTRRRLRG
jgi:lipooligosaccharide transport system permease protein